jgi:hypothetical protein
MWKSTNGVWGQSRLKGLGNFGFCWHEVFGAVVASTKGHIVLLFPLLKYCTIESETWTFSQLVLLTNVNDFHYWWKLRPNLHAEDLSSQPFDFRHVSNYQRILQTGTYPFCSTILKGQIRRVRVRGTDTREISNQIKSNISLSAKGYRELPCPAPEHACTY